MLRSCYTWKLFPQLHKLTRNAAAENANIEKSVSYDKETQSCSSINKTDGMPKQFSSTFLTKLKHINTNGRKLFYHPFMAASATVAATGSTDITPKQEVIYTPEMIDMPETEPSAVLTNAAEVSTNLEPTFESLGLGGYTPVGFFERILEIMHVDFGMPWWGAIAVCTVAVRVLISPLVIMSQRNAAKMNNHMPELQLLQIKMSEARQSGNALDSARYAQEVMLFMKEKQLNPFKNVLVPLAQAPLFVSFFMGLRNMAGKPVESMVDGGLFWFTNLTVPDPTYLLPLITSATLLVTIEIGTDSARINASNLGMMKYVLRFLPIIIFPFTINFPSAILTYWTCSNLISLGQVAILRIPTVRKYFNIDTLIYHKPEVLPMKKKGFVDGVKDSWQNIKITKELEERHQLNNMRFARAGKGPLIKTYKYDPTVTQQSTTGEKITVSSKKNF